MLNKCIECGKEFNSPKKAQYCGRSCYHKYNYEKQRQKIKHTCVECGEEFTSNHKEAKHCSKVCYERYYRRQKRKEKSKYCKVCGNILPKNQRKYCSEECCKIASKKINKNRYKHKCEKCGEVYRSGNKEQRFCSYKCSNEWQKESIEYYKLHTRLEKRKKEFKERFKNKYTNFMYQSGYVNEKSFFKMKCKICGHIQERVANLAKPSKENTLHCENCKKIEKDKRQKIELLNKIIEIKKKSIETLIKDEIEKLKRISKNHKYFNRCSECNKGFFADRSNTATCSCNCQNHRNNRIKEINRRRKLKENGEVNYNISLNKLIERDNEICQICGQPIDNNDYEMTDEGYFIAGDQYPSIDHIIPASKGGTHTWNNIQLAHRYCNSIKGYKIIKDVV